MLTSPLSSCTGCGVFLEAGEQRYMSKPEKRVSHSFPLVTASAVAAVVALLGGASRTDMNLARWGESFSRRLSSPFVSLLYH